MTESEKLINILDMKPHPEGGYFSESFRDQENNVSLIYYLLKKGQRSHWHRLTKNEILHFYKGDSMSVYISEDGKRSYTEVLGNKIIIWFSQSINDMAHNSLLRNLIKTNPVPTII